MSCHGCQFVVRATCRARRPDCNCNTSNRLERSAVSLYQSPSLSVDILPTIINSSIEAFCTRHLWHNHYGDRYSGFALANTLSSFVVRYKFKIALPASWLLATTNRRAQCVTWRAHPPASRQNVTGRRLYLKSLCTPAVNPLSLSPPCRSLYLHPELAGKISFLPSDGLWPRHTCELRTSGPILTYIHLT